MLPYLLAAQRDSHHHCPSPCYPPPPLSPVLHPSEHPWLRDANEAPDTPLGVEVLSRMQSFQAMNKLKKKALKVSPRRPSQEHHSPLCTHSHTHTRARAHTHTHTNCSRSMP
ncbi:unnamed protein product [Closterium sp. NIES-54]